MTDPISAQDSSTDVRKPGLLKGCLLIFGLLVLVGTCNRVVDVPPKGDLPSKPADKSASAADSEPEPAAPVAPESTEVVAELAPAALPSCSQIRSDVIRAFKKGEVQLVKVYGPTEVSRSATEVQCTARAVWSDANPDGIWYRLYVDEEGEQLVEGRAAPLE